MNYRILFVCLSLLLSGYVGAQTPEKTTPTQPAQEQVIRIYGSADCHYCIDAKAYLDQRKIPYLFFDIDRDPEALREMLAKLKQAGMPTYGIAIPVVEKKGELFMNNIPFEDFLKKLD
jgi:glutaredoxin 3